MDRQPHPRHSDGRRRQDRSRKGIFLSLLPHNDLFGLIVLRTERHRDPPPSTADIPVSHRKDARAEHSDTGAWRRAQSDWTAAATGTARPGAISRRRRCTIGENGLVICLVLL